jgi:hypothetical protein
MNRTKHNEPKYTLVAWKDSDVVDMILDCSFAGKLMPKPANNGKSADLAFVLILISSCSMVLAYLLFSMYGRE